MITEEFIKKANLVHNNKYDYSLTKFVRSKFKIKIICPIHGEFEQRAGHHLSGCGCVSCGGRQKSNTEEFIAKANLVHNNKYDYSSSEYVTARSKVKIICPSHGEFIQYAYSHLAGYGCSMCYGSKGEKEIVKILNESGIDFERQKTYEGCKNINVLRFDFYIPSENILIEYNGIQHYKYRNFFGEIEEFNTLQKNDKIKEDYCSKNNIKLITIPYTEFNNIKNIIESYLEV